MRCLYEEEGSRNNRRLFLATIHGEAIAWQASAEDFSSWLRMRGPVRRIRLVNAGELQAVDRMAVELVRLDGDQTRQRHRLCKWKHAFSTHTSDTQNDSLWVKGVQDA